MLKVPQTNQSISRYHRTYLPMVSHDGKSSLYSPYLLFKWRMTFQLHNRCASTVKAECSLGQFANLILPPTSICPAVLDRQRSVSNASVRSKSNAPQVMHFQLSAPQNSCPLLVFVNPKSGGRQGDRILRKFQYLLNPRQVYDLSKGGPIEGLSMFKDAPNFKVICCGGDGTVGWVLEAMGKQMCFYFRNRVFKYQNLHFPYCRLN